MKEAQFVLAYVVVERRAMALPDSRKILSQTVKRGEVDRVHADLPVRCKRTAEQ